MSLDFPSVGADIIRKARQEHKCCECHRTIKVGEKYHLYKGCWDGRWDEFKNCMECDSIREDLRRDCRGEEGPAFGELREWASEAGIEFPARATA